MAGMATPVSNRDVEQLLRESERIQAETAAMRPRSRWLTRQFDQIIAENHLSQRIRQALGD